MTRTHRALSLILSLLGMLLLALPLQAADAPESADTRILIDVSGSMKKNDPKNLRRPALRLLVGLLPEQSRAGVWTFGKYVNMQVPLGMVDKAWKERGRDGAAKIASPGQFTNIEEAIRRSIRDWGEPADKYRRHLVLLTDGMVDVSKNPAESAASRQRILDELLPKLKGLEAQVHTIALSERADHELMKALAGETGGWYEQVEDAEQLQRVFLRIFEKVGRPDTLPLKDNKFTVDASIEEVTLLVFRQAEAPATRVVPPTGESFDAETAPKSVSWHRDEGYDLLTISQPEVGDWTVQAAIDPDNRVVVVTSLKMRVSELPGRIVAGEQVPLAVHFTNEEKKITRQEFLEVVSLRGMHVDSVDVGEPRPIYDDGQEADAVAGDGEFTVAIGEGIAPGKVEYIVNVEGKTFQREQRQLFEVVDPVIMETEVQQQGGNPGLGVIIRPDSELLDMENFSLDASLVAGDGAQQGVMFLPGADGISSEAWIDTSQLQGSWTLGVRVTAKTAAGHDLLLDLEPVIVEGQAVAEQAPEPVVSEPPITEEPQETPVEEAEYGVKEYSIIFGLGNLLLIVLAGAAFWFIRRRPTKDALEMVSEEEFEVVEPQAPVSESPPSDPQTPKGQESHTEADSAETAENEFQLDEDAIEEDSLEETK